MPPARAPLQASLSAPSGCADAGVAQPRRHHAARRRRRRRLQRRRATGAACRCAATRWTTAATTAATACRSTPRPRSRWTTRSALELLKGTSGIQAGTSAPGGLVNLRRQAPGAGPARARALEWREAGTLRAAVDLGQRFGADGAFGLARQRRLRTAATRRCATPTASARCSPLAADWQLGADTLLEAEVETQPPAASPACAGFSLLGDTVPDAGGDRPAHQPEPPALAPAGGDGRRHRRRCAGSQRLGRRLALQRARDDAAADERRPHRVSLRRATTPSYDCPHWCDRYAPTAASSY
ncbi:MAG: hypothetical protein MZW92_70270 [Comamonadaceae bacterium]|nr:hypothetical protein [Comamonadaceae bacterium]